MAAEEAARQSAALEAGKTALARKDFKSAQELLTPLVEVDENPLAALFLARCCFETKKFEKARTHLGFFIDTHPHHTGGQMLLARLQMNAGQTDAAEKTLKSVRKADPEFRPAARLLSVIDGKRNEVPARKLIDIIDAQYPQARTETPSKTFRAAVVALSKLRYGPDWNSDPIQARIAYFHNANDLDLAIRNYDPHLIDVSCQFDYITWPKRIQEHVQNKSVIDIGCGFGGFGMGFLIAGATEYVGLDPAMDLGSSRGKNKRTGAWSDIGTTPRAIEEALPAVRLLQGTSEDLSLEEKFDTIALHTVTEHLLALEQVFEGLVKLCKPESRIVFLHHNFYCWNGHHFAPNQPHKMDRANPAHLQVCDWRHIEIADDLPDDHYFKTKLNRIRLDELETITRKFFDIEQWDEINSSKPTLERLTPAVLRRVRKAIPDLTERELRVNAVFCVARAKF